MSEAKDKELEGYFERKRKEWMACHEFKADFERFKAELAAEVKPPEGFVFADEPTIEAKNQFGDYLAWAPKPGVFSTTRAAKFDEPGCDARWLAFAPSKREGELEKSNSDLLCKVRVLEADLEDCREHARSARQTAVTYHNKVKALENELHVAIQQRLNVQSQRDELRATLKILENSIDRAAKSVSEQPAPSNGVEWESVKELSKLAENTPPERRENSTVREAVLRDRREVVAAQSNGVEWEEDKEGWFWWMEGQTQWCVIRQPDNDILSCNTSYAKAGGCTRVRPKGWLP